MAPGPIATGSKRVNGIQDIETPVPAVKAVCCGTPYEMGLAQGDALKEKICAARRSLSALEAFRLAQPGWLPYPAYRRIAESKSAKFLNRAFLNSDKGGQQRLAGLAAGARVPFRQICLFNALEPLLSSAAGCTACPGACSAVAVTGRRSRTGEPIIARNFDYLPLVQPFYIIRECRPIGGYRSLEFTTAPMAGTVDGINETGLSITYDYAFATDAPAQPAAPISFAIAAALANCRTVKEAASCISKSLRWGGGLLMLADADGMIASLELSNTRSFLRWPDNNESQLFHTNAFCSDALRAVQITDDAIYTNKAPSPLRGRRLHESSECRDSRLLELLDRAEALDADALTAIMADHGHDGVPGNNSPCVHSDYWFTTACLQFFPKTRSMRVSYSTACAAEFCQFEF